MQPPPQFRSAAVGADDVPQGCQCRWIAPPASGACRRPRSGRPPRVHSGEPRRARKRGSGGKLLHWAARLGVASGGSQAKVLRLRRRIHPLPRPFAPRQHLRVASYGLLVLVMRLNESQADLAFSSLRNSERPKQAMNLTFRCSSTTIGAVAEPKTFVKSARDSSHKMCLAASVRCPLRA